MPQYLTLSIGAKIEKGPDIKSEAKVEISNYAPLCEELVCKCTTSPTFEIPVFKNNGLPLYVLIVADKYASDKDCVTPNRPGACDPKKYLKYQLYKPGGKVSDWIKLDRPLILNDAPEFDGIAFKNELTIDVKVSVLVFRIAPEACPTPGAPGSDCNPKPQEQIPTPQGQPVYNQRQEHGVSVLR